MTIVASWLHKERADQIGLWVIADTRLSTENSSKEMVPLLDCGAKLFAIPLICIKQEPLPGGQLRTIESFCGRVGLAFAGSSLIALNLHVFLSYAFGHIMLASPAFCLPTLYDIAHYCAKVLKNLLLKYKEGSEGFNKIQCEVSIFGICPKTRQSQFFHIIVKENTFESTIMGINKIDFTADEQFVHLMGDFKAKEEIKKIIEEYRATLNSKNIHWWNAPQKALEKIIQENVFPTVGGEIQAGIVWPNSGFNLYSVYRPVIHGQPNTMIIYQGINLFSDDNLMSIGNCIIGTSALPVSYSK